MSSLGSIEWNVGDLAPDRSAELRFSAEAIGLDHDVASVEVVVDQTTALLAYEVDHGL